MKRPATSDAGASNKKAKAGHLNPWRMTEGKQTHTVAREDMGE